jgi:hypothetical protein
MPQGVFAIGDVMLAQKIVAVEVRLAELEASRSAISFACELESMAASAARARLFYIGNKIGLSDDAIRVVLDQYELRAKLLHEAHLILRGMIVEPAAPDVGTPRESVQRVF